MILCRSETRVTTGSHTQRQPGRGILERIREYKAYTHNNIYKEMSILEKICIL